MFCKHDWEVVSEHTTESKLELMNKTGVEATHMSFYSIQELTNRKYIQVFKCNKCGKLDKIVLDI